MRGMAGLGRWLSRCLLVQNEVSRRAERLEAVCDLALGLGCRWDLGLEA